MAFSEFKKSLEKINISLCCGYDVMYTECKFEKGLGAVDIVTGTTDILFL